MRSVSGKYWEEEVLNKNKIEKVKIDNDFNDILAKHILSNQFDADEIYSLKNNIELKNPFLNNSDFNNAIEILSTSINNNKKICIIGDYDVDGCISTSLLVILLNKLKASHFYYVPNRFTDGYGSNLRLMKKLVTKKPDLIIMLDNGSSANEAINYLNQKKIKSIIIDHHEIYKPYPDSNILINPKKERDNTYYNYFCTAVLVYFFIDLYIKNKKLNLNFSKYLNLVLLAIISDVMPLRKINRTIAKKVLDNNSVYKNFFFKKIFDLKKIKKPFEIDDFGFLFGPIINSAGRLEDSNIVVKLFTTENLEIKDKIIQHLFLLNEKRKNFQKKTLRLFDLKELQSNERKIIILECNNIHEGLIGIIASNIKTYLNKPVVVITKSGELYKGSARSTNNFNIGKYIKSALDQNIIESGGGHNLAAGFTIKKKKLTKLKNFFYEISLKNNTSSSEKYISKLSLSAINKNFLTQLNKLKPFGEYNSNPYFLIEKIKLIRSKIIDNQFISCYIKNKSGKILSAISFNLLHSDISNHILNNKNDVDIIVQLKENLWNNKKKIQVIIIDLLTTSNKA